jgi:hypothetical protein
MSIGTIEITIIDQKPKVIINMTMINAYSHCSLSMAFSLSNHTIRSTTHCLLSLLTALPKLLTARPIHTAHCSLAIHTAH